MKVGVLKMKNSYIICFPSREVSSFCRIIVCVVIFALAFLNTARAQNLPDFTEIPVSINVKELGREEIPAIIIDEVLYLSVAGLFDYLKITHHFTTGIDSISGYIFHPGDPYLIDNRRHDISYQKKIFSFKPNDLIRAGDHLFLKINYFGVVFGLECAFNMRSLSIALVSGSELPVIRALRLEKLDLKFRQPALVFEADTSIGKKFRLFHIGAIDWSVNATEKINSLRYGRISLNIGGVLAGGDFKTMLYHTTDHPFIEKQQSYLWRFANNDNKVVRQVMVGKIFSQSISSIYDPIVGFQITNAATYYRRSFGSYTYNGYTQPDALVELYVNNTLIDYIRADASGFITYQIPLSYGNTEVMLRYYESSGEVFTEEKNFVIPLTFQPENEFEYTLSAGMVEDWEGSFYSQGRIKYGMTENITVGGGIEYVHSAATERMLPFVNGSVRLAPNIFVNGEYVSDTRFKGNLTYFSPSRIQVEFNYTKYNEPQEAIKNNYTEERKALVSMPFKFRNSAGTSRLSFDQNILGAISYYNVELQLAMATRNVSINITNNAIFKHGTDANIYSTISSSLKLPGQVRFIPRVIYNLTDKQFLSLNLGIEKNISSQLSMNVSYEQRFDNPLTYYRVGARYNFSFARLSSTGSFSKDASVLSMSASGSVMLEKQAGGIEWMNQSNVGKGGVAFLAFLDLNANGIKDAGEIKLKGINVKMHNGGGRKIHSDSTIIYSGLEAYSNYNFTIDGNGLENISWKVMHPMVSTTIDPNQVKLIEVPVVVMGEVSGKVYIVEEGGWKGIGHVKINIIHSLTGLTASTVTESDGYFSYLGLMPGEYSLQVDEVMLKKTNMVVTTDFQTFTIHENREGDIVDDLKCVLTVGKE
jgi:hypothetical protein